MVTARIEIPYEEIAAFCRKWRITELALFGSVLRDDFRTDSDVDVLVSFRPDVGWSLFDHARMLEELEALFGRPVDLVSRLEIERSKNWIRQRQILETAQTLYVA